MRRLALQFCTALALVALWSFRSTALWAATYPLNNVFYISADGDCTNDPCSLATSRRTLCRNSSTDTTIYVCDTDFNFYVAIASGGGGGTPGGSNTQCQFNDSGSFGGDAGCSYSKANDQLTLERVGGNGIFTPLILQNNPATAANGDGAGLLMSIENSAGSKIGFGALWSVATDVTAGSEDGYTSIYQVAAGVSVEGLRITPTGLILPASATVDGVNLDSIPDGNVSDTLTSSLFVGSGSTTTAIDLATSEVAGTLPFARGGTNQTSWTASRCVQVNAGGTALESAGAACGAGGGGAFSDLTTGANTTATMTVGSGASIVPSGTGIVTATDGDSATAFFTSGTIDQAQLDADVVYGPATSTDNAIARFDGTTGKLVQNYTANAPTISDLGTSTFNAGATWASGNVALTTGNITLAAAGATVDGKDLDLVPAHNKIVNICPSGCEYTNLNSACAGETSTAANPITYLVWPGLYSGTQIDCSGEDRAAFVGMGAILQFDTTTATEGVFEPGTATNWTFTGFTVKGKIYADGNLTGGGEIRIFDNQFVSTDGSGDMDCVFVDRLVAGSRVYYENNSCLTRTDGYTCGRNCANAEHYIRNNTFGPISQSSANNSSMKMIRFNSTPCFVYSQANSFNLDAASTVGATIVAAYSWEGSEAAGNCAGTGRAIINGDVSYLKNSTSNQPGSSTNYILVGSGADELDEMTLIGVSSAVSSSDADDTTNNAVLVENTNTAITVHGGRWRTSGGVGNADFNTAGTGKIELFGPDYGSSDLDGGTVNGAYKGLSVNTYAATFGPSTTVSINSNVDAADGLVLDNTNAAAEQSPGLVFSNGGSPDKEMRLRLASDGSLRFYDNGGTRIATLDEAGGLNVVGPIQRVDAAGASLYLGGNQASDTNSLVFATATTLASQTWNDTNDRMEFAGPTWYRLGNRASTPGTCTVGDIVPRDDGTFKYCQASNTFKTGAYIDLAQTWATVQTFTAAPIVSGVDLDFEGGASEGFPRLGQSTTPPATACDTGAEAGRLYFDSDADTDGSVFVCTGATWKDIDDDGAGGGGDSLRVEDGDNAGTFTAMSDADFDDSGDINFTRAAGPPDVVTATVRADSVALTTDTTGNYAAGDAEAGAALTGDSATSFFAAGAIEAARGGTGDDTSGTTGVPRIAAGNWTYDAGVSHLAASTSADLRGVLSDEDGTGAAIFNTPTALTLNVESGSNSVTTVSKVYLLAATCQNATASANFDTPATNAPAATCITGTNTQKAYLDFDQTTDESVQGSLRLPDDWTGNADVLYTWLTTATTGSAIWCFQTVCVNDAETGDPAFTAQNSSTCVSDAAKGSASQYNEATDTAITMGTGTPGTCEAGEILYYRISRDPNATSGLTDDLAADARLVGVELTLRRAQ